MPGDRAPLPKWAPRVPPGKLRRLYELDALGIVDEELIDDVAFAIRARCDSILTATEASRGRVRCPSCEHSVLRHPGEGEILRCERCGWGTPWERYFSTYKRRQLHAGGGEPVFREYLDRFPAADTPRKRMLLIDWVVHQCHQSLRLKSRGQYGRPIAVNLIDARIAEIVDLIGSLAYGEGSSMESRELRERWRETVLSAYGGYPAWTGRSREGD